MASSRIWKLLDPFPGSECRFFVRIHVMNSTLLLSGLSSGFEAKLSLIECLMESGQIAHADVLESVLESLA